MNAKNLVILSTIIMTGCAATGENLKGNVYKAGQVNSAQAARTIKITARAIMIAATNRNETQPAKPI